MFKKQITFLALSILVSLPVAASEPVFSSNTTEVQKINLEPASFSAPEAQEAVNIQTKKAGSLSEENFKNAVTNLDAAQVEVRDQLASYNALVEQSKTEYQAKKAEYNGYKKEYNAMKKQMKSIEKMKKMLNQNITKPVPGK